MNQLPEVRQTLGYQQPIISGKKQLIPAINTPKSTKVSPYVYPAVSLLKPNDVTMLNQKLSYEQSQSVIWYICNEFGITMDDFKGDSKPQNVVRARVMYIYIMRNKKPRENFEAIAIVLNRSHSNCVTLYNDLIDTMSVDGNYKSGFMVTLNKVLRNLISYGFIQDPRFTEKHNTGIELTPEVATMMRTVCRYYGVSQTDLKSDKKYRDVAEARYVIAYGLNTKGYKDWQIASILDKKRTSVTDMRQTFEELKSTPKRKARIEKILNLIQL